MVLPDPRGELSRTLAPSYYGDNIPVFGVSFGVIRFTQALQNFSIKRFPCLIDMETPNTTIGCP